LIKLQERPDAEVLFHGDRSFRHSVFFEFVVPGEQVGTVTPELQVRHPEVPGDRSRPFYTGWRMATST
jgi:hypothetical protein